MRKYPLMTIGFDLNVFAFSGHEAGFGKAVVTLSKGGKKRCYAWVQLPIQVFHIDFELRETDFYHFMELHKRWRS